MVKTYRVLILTALFLLSKGTTIVALAAIPTEQCSASAIQTQLVVLTSYTPPRVGVLGRRVGAGTR